MKPFSRHWFLSCVCITALASQGNSDPAPQPEMEFTQGAQNTFNADWEGVSGRTYFLQLSLDLEMWHYAPFMHFGEGDHQRGIHSTSEKFFLRLNYIDFPNIHSLDDAMNADFDGDGLSNIFEVMNGYSPHKIDSNDDGIPDGADDLDEDGTLTIFEQNSGRDPKTKDHPAVKLSVVVGN
jgi:hypothetical protein